MNVLLNFIHNFISCNIYVAHLVRTLKEVGTYVVTETTLEVKKPNVFLSSQIKVITLPRFAIKQRAADIQALWLCEDKKNVIKQER